MPLWPLSSLFDLLYDRARTHPQKLLVAMGAGAITVPLLMIWRRQHTTALDLIFDAVFGLFGGAFGGIVLVAVDAYEDRAALAREQGRPAPSNLKMMVVYVAWIIGVLAVIFGAGIAWVFWPVR
jgi:hypothetical protein